MTGSLESSLSEATVRVPRGAFSGKVVIPSLPPVLCSLRPNGKEPVARAEFSAGAINCHCLHSSATLYEAEDVFWAL